VFLQYGFLVAFIKTTINRETRQTRLISHYLNAGHNLHWQLCGRSQMNNTPGNLGFLLSWLTEEQSAFEKLSSGIEPAEILSAFVVNFIISLLIGFSYRLTVIKYQHSSKP